MESAREFWPSAQRRMRRRRSPASLQILILHALVFLVSAILPGCCGDRQRLVQILQNRRQPAAPGGEPVDSYQVQCPDVLDLKIDSRPELSERAAVEPDGCIPLAPVGRFRIEGRTVAETQRIIADELRIAPAEVHVHVAEFNSQQIYLVGEIASQRRAVPYHGSETVLDLLQRVGGITPGAAPGDIYVIRSHITDDKTPEVFHVDLQAILLKNDATSNIRLLPFDQVYVGQSRQAGLKASVPPCLRPLYDAIWGLRRSKESPPPAREGPLPNK